MTHVNSVPACSARSRGVRATSHVFTAQEYSISPEPCLTNIRSKGTPRNKRSRGGVFFPSGRRQAGSLPFPLCAESEVSDKVI